jgi:DNA-cytosine methyltransferase
MTVLSLFDGISCGRVALERAGIPVEKYYASEVDKYAIKISASNYSDIVQLGDIIRWQKWNIPKPDLIIGGSPCQGFSFAGKGLNFNDPRSKLFFVYADILRHYKPKYFLLENVKMKSECKDVISEILGDIYPECVNQGEMFRLGRLEPILINSALVSAQNRERLYWCNWKVEQPEDKHILLKNIIINAETDKDKSYCLDANYWKGVSYEYYIKKARRQLVLAMNRVNRGDEIRKDGKSYALTTGHQNIQLVYYDKHSGYYKYWRKLMPVECERLQTLPDNYTDTVSNTQRYRCIGNGWTVDIIAHILHCMREVKK